MYILEMENICIDLFLFIKLAITLVVVFIVAFIAVCTIWTPNGTVFVIAL